MKNIYIMCRDDEFEMTVCMEYVKVNKLNVFQISSPKSEKEKEQLVKEVISLAKKGEIDVFLYYAPIILSNYQNRTIDRLIKIIRTGIEVEMAYYCIVDLFDKERIVNELKPLMEKVSANYTKSKKEGENT